MKLLLISDLHGQSNCLKVLPRIIAKHRPDGLICAGDIVSIDQDAGYLRDFFSILEFAKLDGFVIWGNNDGPQIQKEILRSKYSSHLKSRRLGQWKIYGISHTEDIPEISPVDISGSILITHKPPETASLKVKYQNAPHYHISGHIHSLAKKTDYPSTTHIQVPSLELGRYGIFDPDLNEVKFFTLPM